MSKVKNDWKEILSEAVIVITVLFLFAWPVTIKGSSMEDTLNDGDKIIISRFMGFFDMYEKGDVVVFRMKDRGKSIHAIKRIIADEGDRVVVNEGNVWVNDGLLNEYYIKNYTEGFVDIVVPEGEMFVMGDNRDKSQDSREMGTVKKSDVVGKMIFKFYPFEDASFV